ncbi:GTP cyclohydrolase [Streptococcus pneumoniae]|nr:GTP cyclohydrolase [Streptococcus pneumoniae]
MSLLGQITAQPDFATIHISYIPDKLCVESKSLKLYLFSYRNHGDFHENCINTIGKDLVNLLDPRYLEVWGKFTPRGGISYLLTYKISKLSKNDENKIVSKILIILSIVYVIVDALLS